MVAKWREEGRHWRSETGPDEAVVGAVDSRLREWSSMTKEEGRRCSTMQTLDITRTISENYNAPTQI